MAECACENQLPNGARKKPTMKNTIKIAGRDANIESITAEWLTARMRNGRRRVEVLGWKRLAAIYYANRPGSTIRKAINAEARRCGYTPMNILTLNA
jgi:hypothetical protein